MNFDFTNPSILKEAARAIRTHNHIHAASEKNAILITTYLDFAADLIDKFVDGKIVPVKNGKWLLLKGHSAPDKVFQCSICKNISEHKYYSKNGYYSYCKDCGAEMDIEED